MQPTMAPDGKRGNPLMVFIMLGIVVAAFLGFVLLRPGTGAASQVPKSVSSPGSANTLKK